MLAARGGGAAAPVPVRVLAATGYTYTGLTSRSWTIRFREHRQAAGAGSPLLFHRALRDALFPVAVVEHEVLRAGLTEDEALGVEEAEVEETSLFPLHPRGLNMVPGGRAGTGSCRPGGRKTGRAPGPSSWRKPMRGASSAS
ncbi:MAG: hypothetical protein JNK88_12390 [Mangrovicoccus sp.]|nr:hypothetical protein [Mangrovicoccus sp.]